MILVKRKEINSKTSVLGFISRPQGQQMLQFKMITEMRNVGKNIEQNFLKVHLIKVLDNHFKNSE